MLAIEEWLVGNETRDAVVERTADLDTRQPVPTTAKQQIGRQEVARQAHAATPPAGTEAEIDWGALVPRVIGAEVGPLSGVVPALAAAGEVERRRATSRARSLEALMDTDKRDRIFPTEIGLEPKVVIAGMEAESTPTPTPTPTLMSAASPTKWRR